MSIRTSSILERERRRRGLTATALALRMGVSRPAVSGVERGLTRPSAAFMKKAARALAVSTQTLFPRVIVVRIERPEGVSILTSGDRLVAFSTRSRASSVARRLGNSVPGQLVVHGPVELSHVGELLGLSEAEAEARLVLDPDPEAVGQIGGTRG